MDNNNPFGNDNHNPFEKNQQYDNSFPEQNISGNPFIDNQNIPNQFYGQNIPNNNYIPPQNNYNEPFNRQYVNTPAKKSSKGIYILLITVLICFAVIIFLMFTVIRSMLDGGNKKPDDNNVIISENITTTELQTESPVTTASPVEKVTEIVTVIVEVTAPPVTEPKFNSYTYKVNNVGLVVYANASFDSKPTGYISDRGTYTIVDQYQNWGKLESGGWINFDIASQKGGVTYLGIGEVVTKKDPLNLHCAPDSDAKILTSIPKGTSVEIYESDFPDWYYTTYNGQTGFVSSAYISFDTSSVTQAQTPIYFGYGFVNTEKDSLNVRSEPSTGASIVTDIPKGTSIDLYTTSESGWYYTTYKGKSGFVKSDYISFAPAGESYAPITAVINTKKDPLNLRSSPSEDAKIITTIPKGTTVTVIDYYTDWCYIEWDDYKGYASTEYLAF